MARPWRGAAALLLVVVTLALPTPLPAGAPAAAAATRLRVSLVGDSVAASIAASLPARQVLAGVDLAIDARVCRRTARPGCTWRGSAPTSVRDVVRATPGDVGDVVVVVSGYNDDARRFRSDAAAVLQDLAAAGASRVVWLDLRTPATLAPEARARHAAINQALRALDRVSPLLQVAGWDARSRGHDDWFFDPIHLRAAGAVQLARFLAEQVRGARPRPTTAAAPVWGSRCAAGSATGARIGAVQAVPPVTTTVARRPRPTRLADSRSGSADGLARPLGAGREVRLAVAGRAPVPQSATAALVRVTAARPCGAGTLAVSGCGLAALGSARLARGRPAQLTATVPLGAFGRVCVRSSTQTDVVVDLLGWATT